MAFDSYFKLDTTASPEEVKALILGELPFKNADWSGLTRLLDASSIVVIQRPTRPDPTCQEIGIDAKLTISITCRHKIDLAEVEQWLQNCVKIPMLLLKAYPGDALQFIYDDTPFLMRKDGELYLLNRDLVWMQADNGLPVPHLELVDLPYTFRDFPGLTEKRMGDG